MKIEHILGTFEGTLPEVLLKLKEKENFPKFYEKNLELTRKSIKDAVNEDDFITQAIANVQELDRVVNILSKRLREWHSLHFPELSEEIHDHQKYAELSQKDKEDLQKELQIPDSMGADFSKNDLAEVHLLAAEVNRMFELRKKHEDYLEGIMKKYCPNILELAGITIGARLLELSRGLKRMALLPASTVQLLGAEKALFRHLKTGSRSPKFGVIFSHPIIQKASRKQKGKAARILADKLSLCARLDYFKGEFKAKEYRKEIEGKLEIKE